MKNVYETLRKIIDKKVIIPLNVEKRNIILKESSPGAKLKGIILEGFTNGDKFMAFKLDHKNLRISQYLSRSQEKINMGCDAVITAEINGRGYIFFCELKSDSPKNYENQFKSSHAFVDYIDSLIEKFYDLSLKEFKRIYVLFTSKRFHKTPVHPSSQKKYHCKIDNIPFFFEGNCRRGRNPDCMNIKKYVL